LFKRIWAHRAFALALIRRTYYVRYRQSMVGLLWAAAPTLGTLGAATLVFSKVVRVETGEVPYSLFALAALAPWSFFASSINSGVPSLAAAQSMVSRLAFPRAIH